MGIMGKRRKSKEAAAELALDTPQPTGEQDKKSEAAEINMLIKATDGGANTGAIRERRMSAGLLDPNSMPKQRRMSAEAEAINNLLSQTRAEGTEALRQRRASKEKAGETKKPKESPKSSNGDSPDKVTFAEPAPMSAMAQEINRRIQEDRRVRRASQELQDAERVALERMHTLNKQVEAAEAEAEEQALGQNAAIAGAAARGAAKAAALKANGVFVSNNEWINTQERIRELAEEVKKLREERKDRQTLFRRISGIMKLQDTEGAGEDHSPSISQGRQPGSPQRPGRLQRQKSSDGASFVRKMLDSNAESFVGKVLRSASPNVLRRQASKSRLQNLSKETPAVSAGATVLMVESRA